MKRIMISALVLGLTGAGYAQAEPLNEETRAYYADIAEQAKPQLPLQANDIVAITRAALENDQWHIDYGLPQTAVLAKSVMPGQTPTQAQIKQMMNSIIHGMQTGSKQEYYLATCQSKPPLQPIVMRYRVLDSKGKLLAKWQNHPRECLSDAARQAQARGGMTFERRMVSDNVRLEEGLVKDGHLTARYTVIDQDFTKIHPNALPLLHSKLKQLMRPLVCSPQGGLMPGVASAQFTLQDKNGKPLPPIDMLAVDCARSTEILD